MMNQIIENVEQNILKKKGKQKKAWGLADWVAGCQMPAICTAYCGQYLRLEIKRLGTTAFSRALTISSINKSIFKMLIS
jgi:hypothetical protein